MFFIVLGLKAQTGSWEINSDQWAATDELGRKLPVISEVGDEKTEKLVGMF